MRKTILVLYYSRGTYPLRDTIKTHLYCWGQYSKYKVVYMNAALGFRQNLLRRLTIDCIIFHTSFLGIRWNPNGFRRYMGVCAYLKDINCMKIAIPQDEFLNTDVLNDFINSYEITHVLSNGDESHWSQIYDKIDREKVCLQTVLTGYLDHYTLEKIKKKKGQGIKRDIDIGYRAWKAEYWLGEHGTHKVKVAEVFNRDATKQNLITDISIRAEDTIMGDAWFDFLLKCRATVGVEGGASILDKYGEIKRKVGEYVKEHPNATFEETRTQFFPKDDNWDLFVVTPRHFEACATETCQLLIEGEYSGVLKPWQHYIPVKRDYSNVEEVLDILQDENRTREITNQAYKDIVESGRWTYKRFVQSIEDTIINQGVETEQKRCKLVESVIMSGLNIMDSINWYFIKLEVGILRNRIKQKKIARCIYRAALKLWGLRPLNN